MSPIYRWRDGDAFAYGTQSPGPEFMREDIAFYAATAPLGDASPVRFAPIYEWRDGDRRLLSPLDGGLEQYGFTREGISFFAP
jgi:hypothetical protein